MKKTILSFILTVTLIITIGLTAYGAPNDNHGKGPDKDKTKIHDVKNEETSQDSEALSDVDAQEQNEDAEEPNANKPEKNKHNNKALSKEQFKEAQNALKAEKKQAETLKDEAETIKNQLEVQYEAAVESGDTALAEQLEAQLQEAVQEFNNLKLQFKNTIAERKQLIKSTYTEEELAAVEASKTEILESISGDATVLDVDSIISDSADFKFDTPPVIKSGRTVIPVRAITRGFGAELNWDPEAQQVTVYKNDTTINLTIDSNVALVDGEEVLLDSKAEIMSNRTYVPLRFIMETLGLNVKWDDETDTIEIDEPEDDTDETRTDSAIETSL